jgi:hypothetical protein
MFPKTVVFLMILQILRLCPRIHDLEDNNLLLISKIIINSNLDSGTCKEYQIERVELLT